MLVMALFIDIADCFLPVIADIVGLIFIGGWMLSRSGKIKTAKGAKKKIGKATKWAKRMKWLRPVCFILEFLPFPLPLWTFIVYLELRHN